MKKLIIAGANGFLGRYLTRYFVSQGWEVIGLARRCEGMDPSAKFVEWDGLSLGVWMQEIDGADAVVNLAGRSVNCRYHQENRREILESRVDSTKVLGEAIRQCERPPDVWLNSSTATIYRHAEDRPMSEDTGEIGEGFSVNVAKAWEEAFFGAKAPGRVRKVALRTAMVLADEPGTVYRYLRNLAKFGLGGKVGSGRQMVSWIHVDDFCRGIDWLIDHDEVSGPVNVVAPDALSNAEVMSRFRDYVGVPFGLPATRWMAEVGAFFLRTETELILKSRWVVPTRLLEHGFVFRYPEMLPEVIATEGERASGVLQTLEEG